MKCYYHETDNAVATCQHCGKALCKPCAGKYNPCRCDECFDIQQATIEDNRKTKKKDALIDTNAEFVMAIVKGLIASIAFTLFNNTIYDTATPFLMSIFFFFIPFGWAVITYIEQWLPGLLMSGPLFIVYIILKIVFSMFLGIPSFLYQAVRYVYKITRLSKV